MTTATRQIFEPAESGGRAIPYVLDGEGPTVVLLPAAGDSTVPASVSHTVVSDLLRGSGVDSDMRDWALQARNEDHDWVTLREHLGDQLLASGDYGGWPVYGRLAQLAYRFFRVVVRGTSTLAICHWELYGYFM